MFEKNEIGLGYSCKKIRRNDLNGYCTLKKYKNEYEVSYCLNTKDGKQVESGEWICYSLDEVNEKTKEMNVEKYV